MNLIFVGDVVGKGGRNAVRKLMPELKRQYNCSFSIVNAENIAAGAGLSAKCIKDLEGFADVITSGDHVWDQKDFDKEITLFKNVLRPANLSKLQPGKGYDVFRNPAGGDIAVINLLGRVFMKESAYCPFETVENILKTIPANVKSIFVDIHAEATSEKAAMARFLDGKVTAVLGTHTHVQTADAQVYPGGTAFISDVGMTGADYSVLGRSVDDVLRKFRTGMPGRLNVVETGIRLDAAIITYDYQTGKAEAIKNISVMAPDGE